MKSLACTDILTFRHSDLDIINDVQVRASVLQTIKSSNIFLSAALLEELEEDPTL
jgi:hypothetical protein